MKVYSGLRRFEMWYLFTLIYSILILGSVHDVFQQRKSLNPEASMNISQIISYWGYPDEEYNVITEDGYILGLYRIPYGKTNSNSSDAGYDVWMGNSRGNTWSKKHVYLETNSSEFWAFSFDEMAKYDLPASIDFIEKQTGQEEIFYVGHSQGTTIAFIAFSTMPKIAKKIKIFFALAPVVSINHIKSPLFKMAIKWKSVMKAFFGNKEFLPQTSFNNFIGSKLCPQWIFNKICLHALFMMFGHGSKNFNTSRLDVYFSHNPAGTSVQNILHWGQLQYSTHLKAFDWGNTVLNMIHFNKTTPPSYNVTNMNVTIATWNGEKDLLADPEDIEIFYSEITNLIYHKSISHYNHMDFLLGLDAYQHIYHEIIDIIQNIP
ncbi:lipase member J isoform 2-T2 [Thomomys bottae]